MEAPLGYSFPLCLNFLLVRLNMDLLQVVELWSQQINLDPGKYFILTKVPIDVSEDIISEVLNTVKVFGCAKIRGRRGDNTGSQMFVLVETSLEIDTDTVPPEVGIPGEVGPWGVHVPSVEVVPEGVVPDGDFQEKLVSWLSQEGKSLEDVKPILSTDKMSNVGGDLVQALDRLVERCNQAPVESLSYRKLRVFSGQQPIPPGEEDYDSWMEQATQMVSEWQCTESSKKTTNCGKLEGVSS